MCHILLVLDSRLRFVAHLLLRFTAPITWQTLFLHKNQFIFCLGTFQDGCIAPVAKSQRVQMHPLHPWWNGPWSAYLLHKMVKGFIFNPTTVSYVPSSTFHLHWDKNICGVASGPTIVRVNDSTDPMKIPNASLEIDLFIWPPWHIIPFFRSARRQRQDDSVGF